MILQWCFLAVDRINRKMEKSNRTALEEVNKILKETSQAIKCIPVRKLPLETIVSETLQVFVAHNLNVHEVMVVLKAVKKEVKRQSFCALVSAQT